MPPGRGRGGAPVGRAGPAADPTPGGSAPRSARLLAWAETSDTGDRAELDFEPRPQAWSSVSVGSEECPGAQACPSGRTCFAEAAYERAREADVVVVNLHLLGAHVASGGYVLPEHDVLVVDEAHETEDVFSGGPGGDPDPRPGRRRGPTGAGQRPGPPP